MGSESKVMMRPIPTVAAEMARGSDVTMPRSDCFVDSAVAASNASGTHTIAAINAKASDVPMTRWVEIARDGRLPEKILRHAVVLKSPPA